MLLRGSNLHVYISQRLTYSVKSYKLKYKQRQLEINFNSELVFHPFISEADDIISGL